MDITILESEVNVLVVLIATVLSMVVGFVYYMPNVPTGKLWIKLVGLTEKQMKEASMMPLFITVLLNLITAVIIAILVPYVGTINQLKEVPAGLLTGFMLWLLVVIASFSNTLFRMARKKLWAVESGYSLIIYLMMGAVIAVA